MALPSRLQRGAARESPEEEYYSGLHSVSEVPTACPSQLFRVRLCGRVWYQWNADSLRVALTPIFPTAVSLSLPRCRFRLKQFPHIQKGGAGQEVFQGLGSFQPFDKRGCANAAPWPWQQLSSRSASNCRTRRWSTLTNEEVKIKNTSIGRSEAKMLEEWGQEAVLDLNLRAWRSGRADLASMNVWGEKEVKNRAVLPVSFAVTHRLALHWHHHAALCCSLPWLWG